MIVVPDAGPLIYLAGAGQLDVLHRLYAEVVVPRLVYDPALLGRLDAGEAAAIPLALALGATLLVDDGEARAVATERGLPVVGSLGVLVAAKRLGHLPEVAPTLERMVRLGMFVSPALRDRVLALAGEFAGPA